MPALSPFKVWSQSSWGLAPMHAYKSALVKLESASTRPPRMSLCMSAPISAHHRMILFAQTSPPLHGQARVRFPSNLPRSLSRLHRNLTGAEAQTTDIGRIQFLGPYAKLIRGGLFDASGGLWSSPLQLSVCEVCNMGYREVILVSRCTTKLCATLIVIALRHLRCWALPHLEDNRTSQNYLGSRRR